MRLPLITAAALAFATPALSQSITVTGPNPRATDALHHDSTAARSDAQVNRAEARTDDRIARRDAADGNHVGAAAARRDARINTSQARHDGAIATQDNARAASRDSTHISIVP